MDIKDHPCAQGLTEECFRAYPQWAKKMFAYRLLLTLCPHEITKRLPQLKGLFPLLVPPDWPPSDPWVPGYSIDPAAVFPPDWTPEDPLPDGVTLDPGTVFPPGWTAGDPLPAGVTISPGAVFPPGWTPGDTLPAGVTISPGAVFPPGWTAGDPLPAGVTISPGAVFPPGWTAGDPLPAGVTFGVSQRPSVLGGAIPPIFLFPGLQSPPHRPIQIPIDEGIAEVTLYAENDCQIKNYQTTWDETRNGATGTGIFCDVGIQTGMVQAWRGATAHQIRRYFFSVDLSTIPVAATITGVVLRLTSYGSNFCGVSVQEGTQAETITTGDYDQFTGNYFAEIDWVGGINEFTFNQAGLDFMTGEIGTMAKVCLREYDHDYGNVQPAVNDNFLCGNYGPTTANDEDKPQFMITYET